jgi:DNA-3-methyladenine glycosylase
LRKLTSGPGRLAEAFGITRERDNTKDLTSADSDLFLSDDAFPASQVLATRRIGITKAEDMPLRYLIAGNPFVSGPKEFGIIKASRNRGKESREEGAIPRKRKL